MLACTKRKCIDIPLVFSFYFSAGWFSSKNFLFLDGPGEEGFGLTCNRHIEPKNATQPLVMYMNRCIFAGTNFSVAFFMRHKCLDST